MSSSRAFPRRGSHRDASAGPIQLIATRGLGRIERFLSSSAMEHELTTLDNGLRLITHDMPSIRSVAIGCWIDTGSRDESGPEAGASHFLEHLLFKGSDTWSARDISEAFDGIGARHNAFTSKEYTCFWTRMRDDDLPLGIEILSEMLRRPAFRQDEIDSERHVVLEEINMNEDDPTDVAHELFIDAIWRSHALAPPILGTTESILGMSRDTISSYWKRRYTPRSTVVAIAGNLPENLRRSPLGMSQRSRSSKRPWKARAMRADGMAPARISSVSSRARPRTMRSP